MNTDTTKTTMYGIKDACKLLGLSEVYVRRMILKGIIPTTKVEIRTNTFKHLISEDDLNIWRESVKGRSRREDGRSKFTLYASIEELAQIQALLEENSIESPVIRSNKVKTFTE